MTGRRRVPAPPLHVDARPVFARIVALHGAGNATSGLALMFGDPGTSGTFALMIQALPLPVWGAALLSAGLLQFSGGARVMWGHGAAAAVWLFTAGAALLAVSQGVATSSAGSFLLTGLLGTVAGLHLNGLVFRRAEQLAAQRAARGE